MTGKTTSSNTVFFVFVSQEPIQIVTPGSTLPSLNSKIPICKNEVKYICLLHKTILRITDDNCKKHLTQFLIQSKHSIKSIISSVNKFYCDHF